MHNPSEHVAFHPVASKVDDIPCSSEAPPCVDPFDNFEEYVGVNDEHFYMGEEYVGSQQHYPDEHLGGDQMDVDDGSNENIFQEAEVDDADPNEVILGHDPENPCIKKYAKFKNMDVFKKSIIQHAVLEGFEIKTYKSDSTRFVGYCQFEGCTWRVHASRLQDGVTIMCTSAPLPKFLEERWLVNTGLQIG